MSKRYIDIPVVGYETWLISSDVIDSDRNMQCGNEDDKWLDNLSHDYLYNEKHKHVI